MTNFKVKTLVLEREVMAVKIKLQRLGKIRTPHYRVIVADSRTRRSGEAIEVIGHYEPKQNPSFIEINSERVQYWLGVGAQPTDPVLVLLKITGDWQTFKDLPGKKGTLKVADPKPSKQELFAKALAEADKEVVAEATTPKKKKPAKKSTEDKADSKSDSAVTKVEATDKPDKTTEATKTKSEKKDSQVVDESDSKKDSVKSEETEKKTDSASKAEEKPAKVKAESEDNTTSE